MTDHLITPPFDLVKKWANKCPNHYSDETWAYELFIAQCAAQWGAKQELEACCAWLPKMPPWSGEDLRRDRRLKQPTPKELALLELADLYNRDMIDDSTHDTICVALEALPND